MKTAISIPDSLFSAGERLARRLGISRSRLYQMAVREFLDRHGDTGVTEGLDRLYGDENQESRLDPILARLQGTTLSGEGW
jgi:metal-responsive CopG/Arc/MetJ family transcriptional regulator